MQIISFNTVVENKEQKEICVESMDPSVEGTDSNGAFPLPASPANTFNYGNTDFPVMQDPYEDP